MATTSCHLLQLHFPKFPCFSPFRPPSSLSIPPRRSLRLSASFSGPISPEPDAVAHPALANANVLFFRSGYNVQIVVDENESEEALLRRFRREVSKAGIIQECKRRRFYENPQEERKRKAREASRRNRRRRSGPRFLSSSQSQQDEAATKKEDDTDDNWDLPEGDLPY
ncbi:putative ribosomal protein S21 [Dioscorea sansibarensis]